MRKIFLALLLFGNPAIAQEDLHNLLQKYEGVGLSVAVVQKGKIVHTEALGLKSLEEGTPLRTNDLFRIASISKSFTATALMQLQERGKLKLSQDVSEILGYTLRHPQYPQLPITVKMLMSHTSSLNDSQGYFSLDVLTSPKEEMFNAYAPGKGYQYCNLNYNLLGAIVEIVSGIRFDDYIALHILSPLALQAGYRVDALPKDLLTPLYANEQGFKRSDAAYHPRRNEIDSYKMGHSTPIFSPTGGMKISAPDLAKYMLFHMNYGKRGVLKKKSAKTMQTPVLNNYGLGLLQTDKLIPGKIMVGHTGSAYGLYSAMFFHPKEKFGYVLITNGCKDCSGEPYNKLLQEALLYLDRTFRK
jgi:CubicO group peptidase (beta-lactamase class C family)